MENVVDQLVSFAAAYGLQIIGAIVILIAGRFIAKMARKGVRRLLTKADVDVGLVQFTGNLVYTAVLAFAILAALAKFGVQTASFVAVMGAAGFAVGFALQGSLSNFAAGVMLLALRPFKVGDVIEAAGVKGSVASIQLFSTIINTPDNVKIIVPNGKIFGDTIKNISAYDTRRVDFSIGIGYSSSIQKAQDVVEGLVKADDRILSDPEPFFAVSELADSSVNLVIRVWVEKANYWPVYFDLTRRIKESFDENGIEIPFPQRVIHTMSAGAAA